MKKVLNSNFQAGSTTCNEPRPVADILDKMLSSKMKKDILLCIDLKAYLQTDDLVEENKPYHGILMLDDDYNARFVERPGRATARRNLRIFDGRYITMTYRPRDGHVRLNFKELRPLDLMNIERLAEGVKIEIRMAARCCADKGLGEVKLVGW